MGLYEDLVAAAAWKVDLQDNGSGTSVAGGGTLVGASNTSDVSVAAATPAAWLPRAMQFNGSSQGASLSYAGTTISAASYECWMRLNSAPGTAYDGIITKRLGTASTSSFTLLAKSGSPIRLGYSWSNIPTEYNWTGGPAITLGTWYHVVLVVSASSAKFYVDGVLVATNSIAHSAVSDALTTTVGYDAANFGGERYSAVTMKGVRQYNFALSDAQVTALYAGPTQTSNARKAHHHAAARANQ